MKGRIFLIHWNAAESEALATELRKDSWQVTIEAEDGGRAVRSIKADPPEAVVIYLTRLPSHGRETAHALRAFKATRHIPIVFVGGEGEALEKTKAKAPDAIYTSESRLSGVLDRFAKDREEDDGFGA